MPPRKSAPKPPTKLTDAEQLALLCAKQRLLLNRAGRSLHDSAGPLLSAAGIHLQLLKMDVPSTGSRIQEVSQILEQALDNVREVSQALAASPVYRGGFHAALSRLMEETAESAPVDIHLDYSATTIPGLEPTVALYDAVAATLRAAVLEAKATEVEIQVRDKPSFHIRVSDNGRSSGRARILAATRLLAREAGIVFEIMPGKSTIVSIRVYGVRRLVGR